MNLESTGNEKIQYDTIEVDARDRMVCKAHILECIVAVFAFQQEHFGGNSVCSVCTQRLARNLDGLRMYALPRDRSGSNE